MIRVIILLASALLYSAKLTAQHLLIPFGSSWSYFDQGKEPGASWQQPAFADSAWKTGTAILGYGNLNETTLLSYGPDATRKYTTTYFRKVFTLDDSSLFASFEASIKRDDGAVVYVNGVEVYRSNLPQGPITYTTLAQVADDDGRILQSFRLVTAAFRVTFSEPVTRVDANDFQLSRSGTVSAALGPLRPYGTNGSSYDIGVQSIAGEGSLGQDLKDAGTGIADLAGNALPGGYEQGHPSTGRYQRYGAAQRFLARLLPRVDRRHHPQHPGEPRPTNHLPGYRQANVAAGYFYRNSCRPYGGQARAARETGSLAPGRYLIRLQDGFYRKTLKFMVKE